MTNKTRREVLLDLSEDLKEWMEDHSLGFTASQYARLLRRIQWHADQTPTPSPVMSPPLSPAQMADIQDRMAEDARLMGVNSVVRGQPGAYRDSGRTFQAPSAPAPCLHSVYGKGTCLLPRGHTVDHDFGVTTAPPEETNPPVRAHLKAPAPDHAPDCRQPHTSSESCTEANVPSRTLSTRQALGEALACLERARSLLRIAADAPADSPSGFDARVAAFRAYHDADCAWGCASSARALIVESAK